MKKPAWPKVRLTLDGTTEVPAVAPLIISASRSTDIPACFPAWFMEQLEKGYCRRTNPFNGKSYYVSFENVRVIAFWSKNPGPLLPRLEEIRNAGIDFFFQLTVNDYEPEGWEPSLPPLGERIATVAELSKRIGRERLLWRFDPLIITDTLPPRKLLDRIEKTGDRIAPFVSRLTVSFLTPYRSVMRRLKSSGIGWRETSDDIVRETGEGLAALSEKWGLEVVTCAERADLGPYGIHPGSCIDPHYVFRVFRGDGKLMRFFFQDRQEQLNLPDSTSDLVKKLKDPGQRKLCGCMLSKDIGRYGTCTNGCIYCYARK